MVRAKEERGASAVIVAILLVVFLGMLSLSVDGGFLFLKFRGMRNANDAAALAAAQSCARSRGLTVAAAQADADAQADSLAVANVGDAVRAEDPVYTPSCNPEGGTVTVHYQGQQPLFFGQVVGVSSPKTVSATATATWGGVGSTNRIAPLMLSMNRLSEPCRIPSQVAVDTECRFWWDAGSQQDTSWLSNAEWGLMALDSWGKVGRYDSCTGYTASQTQVTEWIRQGYNGTVALNDPPPTYVCRHPGSQGEALNTDINSVAGDILYFPVNDPQQQVGPDGALCRPDGVDGSCPVDKYAIVGFAKLEVVWAWKGKEAITNCQYTGPISSPGSVRCLKAIWRGYTVDATDFGGQNFGWVGVSLSG